MKKIIDNLYLGDRYSAPSDAKIIINCAEELFPLTTDQNLKFFQHQNHWYFNFKDSPTLNEISKDAVSQCLMVINEHLQNQEKVYVHCLWGVNRSASMVLMYLVKNDFLRSKNLNDAIRQFQKNYPSFSPNPGWLMFLQKNYPFKNL